MAEIPIGPRRVYEQAVENGFEACVEHGSTDASQAWKVAGSKGGRAFSGLWTKVGDAGVKAVGLWTWESGKDAESVKLADLRGWLLRA